MNKHLETTLLLIATFVVAIVVMIVLTDSVIKEQDYNKIQHMEARR